MFLYFFGDQNDEEVKIGKTDNLERRKHEHETVNGIKKEMVDLAFILATPPDESKIKTLFKKHTSRPHSVEWFHASREEKGTEIRKYIRWLRCQPYVAQTIDEALTLKDTVDSSHWMYTPERTKTDNKNYMPFVLKSWDDMTVDKIMEGDFYTPSIVIEAVRQVMGTIDLDVASCHVANKVVKASMYYNVNEDGLSSPWSGKIWCNPPFGAWGKWVEKTLTEIASGRVTEMCLLGPTRAMTNKGITPVWKKFTLVWIPCGRFEFSGPNAAMCNDGHFVAYYGTNQNRFSEVFKKLGGSVFSSLS